MISAWQGVKPDQVVQFTDKDGGSHTIYLWTTPLKKEKEESTSGVVRDLQALIFHLVFRRRCVARRAPEPNRAARRKIK